MRKPERPNPRTYIHPIWNGIGCILLVLIPAVGWVLSAPVLTLAQQKGYPLPAELSGGMRIPSIPFGESTLGGGWIPLFNGRLLFTLILSVVLFSILTLVYYGIYRLSGGGRGNPLDLDMPQRPPRRRRR